MKIYDIVSVKNTENEEVAEVHEGEVIIDDDSKPYTWSVNIDNVDNLNLFDDLYSSGEKPLLEFATPRHGVLIGSALISQIKDGTRIQSVSLEGDGPL